MSERFKLEFPAEGFNVFNRANFGLPASTVGTSNYGQLSTAGDPRDIQFGLKLVY